MPVKLGYRHIIAVTAMGAAALAGQVLAMRELTASLRGNELTIALALGVWLLLVGVFSLAGTALAPAVKDIQKAAALVMSALAAALPVSVALPRIMPHLMGYPAGEVVPAGGMLLVIVATLLVVSPLVGLMFPLAVAALSEEGPGGAATVYSLESLGSFGMGVAFTFVFAPYLTPLQGSAVASALCVVGAYSFMGRAGRLVKGAFSILALLAFLLFYMAPSLETTLYNLAGPPARVVEAVWSKYGAITALELPGQHAIYVDGAYAFSVPDKDVAERKAHLPMIVSRSPYRVLMVGGGGEGVLTEVLKHPVKTIDYVELDPRLIEVSMRYMTGEGRAAFKDPRVSVHYEDGRRFISDAAGPYDLVMVSLPEPMTAAINRYYTIEFFKEAKRILSPGGALSISLPSSPNYIGKRQQALSGSIYHTLRAVFPYVRVTPEDTNYFFGYMQGDAVSFDTAELSRRFNERGVSARSFNQYTLQYALLPGRVAYVEARLAGSKGLGVNRDFRPVAYLYALSVWGEVADVPGIGLLGGLAEGPAKGKPHRLLLLAAPCLLLLALLYLVVRRRPRRKAYFVIATTGFAGIVMEVAALLAFQSRYGYLYEMVGLLMASFMLGLAIGSRFAADGHLERLGAARALFGLEVCLMLSAAGLIWLSLAPETPLFGAALAFMIFITGTLSGAEFPVALSLAKGPEGAVDNMAGRLYGLDLIGSSLGALVCGLVFVPLLGIAWTAACVLILKTISACFLLEKGGL